jgi:imidazolonepropionase-like amidohydrolase
METGKALMRRVESLLRHSGSIRRMLVKTLVRGRGIIDGTGTGYLDGYGLLIEDRRILTAAAHEELEGRQDEVLDLEDAIVLPGFVDAHTHITVRPGRGISTNSYVAHRSGRPFAASRTSGEWHTRASPPHGSWER